MGARAPCLTKQVPCSIVCSAIPSLFPAANTGGEAFRVRDGIDTAGEASACHHRLQLLVL